MDTDKYVLNAIEELSKLTIDPDGTPVSIMVETGEDEAIMVGTKDDYVRLAMTLLESILERSGPEGLETQVGDTTVRSILPAKLFDRLGHVVPSCLWFAETADEKEKVRQHFYWLEGK
ncbi:hypothetical protein [Thalassoglobus neptunius]|nr:hypothetical protein [Thalassoglobus neptunius]